VLKEISSFSFVLDRSDDEIEECVMAADAVSNLSCGRIINYFTCPSFRLYIFGYR
jgi:hypothetical protein